MNHAHLFTAVWGSKFTEFFCRYTLPTILTQNNIKALASLSTVTFTIVTNPESEKIIYGSEEYKELSRFAKVITINFEQSNVDRHSHWVLWHEAINSNPDIRHHAVIIPDCIYRDGILTEIFTKLWSGVDLVYYPLPQVVEECILESFDDGHAFSGFSVPEMVELWIKYLNPKHAATFEKSPYWIAHPEYIISARNKTVYLSELAGHALALNNKTSGVSYHFNAMNPDVRIHALEIGGVSCEPLMKFVEQYQQFVKIGASRIHLSTLGSWASHFREGYFRKYSKCIHRLCYSDGGSSEVSSQLTENRLKCIEARVTYNELLNKIWQEVEDISPNLGDKLCPPMITDPYYYQALRHSGQYTIFVPILDQKSTSDLLGNILRKDDKIRRELTMMHIIPGFIDLDPGFLFVLKNEVESIFGAVFGIGEEMESKPLKERAFRGRVLSRSINIGSNLNLIPYSVSDYCVG